MKITTWNGEWLDTAWGVVSGKYSPRERIFPHEAPTKAHALKRIQAVSRFIENLGADILFLCEAPKGKDEMVAFTKRVAPDYELITRPSGQSYETKGRQWQWFLVRKTIADQISPNLLPVDIWRDFAATEDSSIDEDGSWKVATPRLRTVGGVDDVPVSTRVSHSFHREPQILKFSKGGATHEVIGTHLKSKFAGNTPRQRKNNESFEEYLNSSKKVREYIAASHEARIKLSSEALAIRAYIDRRFSQDASPSILVLGDLNDGPGKELMEREFLLHDLISNLQGEVFFARRFLNHALFDQSEELRWTCKFRDKIDPGRSEHILLDHILFTQALTRNGNGPLYAESNSGYVEHRAFEETESEVGKGMLSDHRPVSLKLTLRSN